MSPNDVMFYFPFTLMQDTFHMMVLVGYETKIPKYALFVHKRTHITLKLSLFDTHNNKIVDAGVGQEKHNNNFST